MINSLKLKKVKRRQYSDSRLAEKSEYEQMRKKLDHLHHRAVNWEKKVEKLKNNDDEIDTTILKGRAEKATLSDDVKLPEIENGELQDKIEELMVEEIVTFEKRKYKDNIQLCCYELLSLNVGSKKHWKSDLLCFNILFYDGAGVYYTKDHFKSYLKEHHNGALNVLLKAVLSDLDDFKHIAGFKALGIINKIVTGPFWRKLVIYSVYS